MATTELDVDNVIAMTEADLRYEQKKAMERVMEEYMQLLIFGNAIRK